MIVDNNPNSKDRPVRDLPGEFLLSRGYVACSCEPCMNLYAFNFPHERQRYDHSILYSAPSIGCLSPDDLSTKLRAVFDQKIKIQVYEVTTVPVEK